MSSTTNASSSSPNFTMLSTDDLEYLYHLPGNSKCCDCDAPNPSWCTVSFGTLICLDCSGKHRGLGTHISFVRSLTMDSFSPLHLSLLKLSGGNDHCNLYLQRRSNGDDDRTVSSTSIREKYDNPFAQLYKEWLMAKVEGHDVQAAHYLKLLQQQQQQAAKTSSSSSPATTHNNNNKSKTMSFANTTSPPPSFFSSFVAGWKFSSTILESVFGTYPWWLTSATWSTAWWLVPKVMIMLEAGGGSAETKNTMTTTLLQQQQQIQNSSLSLTALSFFRSITLNVLAGWMGFRHILLPLYMVYSIHKYHNSTATTAFPSTVQEFTRRVQQGRAKRNPGYDIFFPPNVSVGDAVSIAMVFYPDIFVDHMAYSKILSLLSDHGILIVLIHNAEPHRLPTLHQLTGHSKPRQLYVEQIMKHDIETLLGIQVGSWAIGGHFLGSYTASRICHDLLMQQSTTVTTANKQSSSLNITKCIHWGGGEWSKLGQMDNNKDTNRWMMETLYIDASNDLVALKTSSLVGSGGGGSADKVLARLRQKATLQPQQYHIIEGGNHKGFGHYGAPNSRDWPFQDGERTITLEDQQAQIIQKTVEFLLKKKQSSSSSSHHQESKKLD